MKRAPTLADDYLLPAVGTRVRSGYNAPWYGTVVGARKLRLKRGGVNVQCRVLVTHDRCGNPMRKPDVRTLSAGLLEHLAPERDPELRPVDPASAAAPKRQRDRRGNR